MAAKNTKRPRPNKNSDGQDRKPSMSHDINISPAPPPEAPTPPGAPAPGATNPLTHPAAPAMQSGMSAQPAGPSGAPTDQRQVQERIQFKDLQPPAQNQMLQQQGIDPYAPIKQAQGALDTSMQQGPSAGPVPNVLNGPFLPPDVASFPDDFAHLQMLMNQGYGPGASGQEHELGQNARALAAAKIEQAMEQGQQGAGMPTPMPTAPPAMASSMQGPPPMGQPPAAPGAPGGIPPEVIAGLVGAAQKRKRPVR